MPWRFAALEDIDDDHTTAAAWARAREGRLVAIMMIGIGSLALRLLATEQLAGAIDVVGAGGLGEQAVGAGSGTHPWAGGGCKPLGGAWMRKRRMNSLVASVIVL